MWKVSLRVLPKHFYSYNWNKLNAQELKMLNNRRELEYIVFILTGMRDEWQATQQTHDEEASQNL